jgi:hypothetical protein
VTDTPDSRMRFSVAMAVIVIVYIATAYVWGRISNNVAAAVSLIMLPVATMIVLWRGRFLRRTFPWYPLAWLIFGISAIPPVFVIGVLLVLADWAQLVDLISR